MDYSYTIKKVNADTQEVVLLATKANGNTKRLELMLPSFINTVEERDAYFQAFVNASLDAIDEINKTRIKTQRQIDRSALLDVI